MTTVTCAVPAPAMSAAGIAAVSWLALTNVVVRVLPFHRTVAPLTKFVPVTVKVNAGPPAGAELGERALSVGAAVVVNGSAFERLVSGLTTVTCAVPAPAMSAAGIAAVSWLALPNVVVRLLPFHRTVAPLTKFAPVTVKVNPGPPAGARSWAPGRSASGPTPSPRCSRRPRRPSSSPS